MKRKYIMSAVVLVLIILIAWKLRGNKKKLDEKKQPSEVTVVKIPVKVSTAEEQLLNINIHKTGELIPFKEAKALSMISGTITKLNFGLGDQVNQGQILAVTDTHLLQLELQKSEENKMKFKNDLQTYIDLLKNNAATQEKVNELRRSYTDQVNQSEQLRKQISDAAIKAPTSGIISVKSVEQGVFVNAGMEIATIVNLSKAKVQVNLTETEVYQVKNGQTVKIKTDVYPDKIFEGKISFISPQADATHNYMVEIAIDNTQQTILRSGTFVYVDFSKKTNQQILLIPREALTESVRNAFVYVVENDIVQQRTIETGIEINGMIEVLSGLNKGDQVVVSGQINLQNGTHVNISK